MRLGFLLALLLNLPAAYALEKLDSPTDDKTPYEKIGDMYKIGSRPDPKEIVNTLWVGRCFMEEYPDSPMAGVFYLKELPAFDAGPIHQSAARYENYESGGYNFKNPDEFDKLRPSQVRTQASGMEVTIKKDSLSWSPEGDHDYQRNIKMSGNYLVEEKHGIDIHDKSSVIKRCYYYIQNKG